MQAKTKAYLFPGQGADYRLFSRLNLNEAYDTIYMSLPTPNKNENLHNYAMRFIDKIDTSEDFILIGVSLGGMICSELADTLSPVKTILISSAKSRKELPNKYRFQKYFPLNKLVPRILFKWGALLLQPIVEPDRNKDKDTFKSMLKSKNKRYLKRTVNMIINWEKEDYNKDIIHIHGDNDHTLPLENIRTNHIVEGGSHMMMLTRGEEISKLINSILISS